MLGFQKSSNRFQLVIPTVSSSILPAELAIVKVVVKPSGTQQFVVISSFNDLPSVDDQDLIRIPDGTQTVGYDETGPSFHQLQHRLLDMHFGTGIHTARCFIQN
jgi:hypothetical protein